MIDELKKYTKVHKIESNSLVDLMVKLQNYNTVIIGLHRSNKNPWKPYQFKEEELNSIYEIAKTHKVILNVFVKPYALSDLVTIA